MANHKGQMYVFGELLRGFRQREGMTQQALAVQLGVHRRTISDWERSEYLPRTREMVLDLAEALGLSQADVDRLLIVSEYPPEHLPEAEVIFAPSPGLPLGAPMQALPLPKHFVPRPDMSDTLKACLLAEENAVSGVLVVSAVHGLGGIGKTTLVAALARNPAVQRHFPDGILWATLGQEPKLLARLQEWIQSLGDYQFHPTTVDGASAHLRTLLHDKACLLVVDDGWLAQHVRPFLVGGNRCRVIITTRDAGLARKVGAQIHDLEVMTETQALALFERRLGPLDGAREQAEKLARVLGYLPLALELAAAQVEVGWTWGELLDAFRQEMADLTSLDLDEAECRNESLRLSFRLSLERLSQEDIEAFLWLGVLPEDARLNPAMAATLWNQPEPDARKRLRRLRDRALLKAVGDDVYTVHDLLHDEAQLRLSERMPLPEAHAALLDRYQVQARDNLWHTLPDDGYVHSYLAWHLERAGQEEEIHTLLREETDEGRNGWYQAREQLGQTAGYLDDVRRAWQLAQERAAVGLECRCALLIASINSLAGHIPTTFLEALVKQGVWTPVQGLTYARQVPDPGARAEALVALAPLLSAELLDLALEEAYGIEDGEDQARALTGLAFHLSAAEEKGQALRQALAALTVAPTTEKPWTRANVLRRLAPHLPVDSMGKALAAALGIRGDQAQAEALVGLAPRLPAGLLGEALAAAQRMKDEWSRAVVLTGLAPHMHSNLLGEALAVAHEMENEWAQAYVLAGLAPYLSAELLRQALSAARKMKDEQARVKGLAGLAPHLPKGEQTQLLDEALALARGIGDIEERAYALVALAPHLPVALREALINVRDLWDGEAKVGALMELVPHLPVELLSDALEVARHIWDDEMCASALVGLAPHLSAPLLREAQTAARQLDFEWDRARALGGLVPYAPAGEKGQAEDEALMVARGIEDEGARAEALQRLAPHLSGELHGYVLEAVRSLRTQWTRKDVLAELSPRLPSQLLPEALLLAQAIGDEGTRAVILAMLVANSPTEQKGKILSGALTLALTIGDEEERAQAMARLAPYLSVGLLGEALVGALCIRDEWAQAKALAGLVPCLPAELLGEALAAVQGIQVESDKVQLLAEMVSRLPAELLDEALAVVRSIGTPWNQAKALACQAPQLPEDKAYRVLTDLLAAARAKCPGEIWPQVLACLACYLTGEEKGHILAKAMKDARYIENEGARARAVIALGRHLPVELLEEALEVAWNIEDEWTRAQVVAALGGQLPVELLEEALVGALCIRDEWAQAKALAGLAPHLPMELVDEALAEARRMKHEIARARVLAGLAPYLPAGQKSQVLSQAFTALVGVQDLEYEQIRVEALAGLAPHLPLELMDEALAMALNISNKWDWQMVLAGLAARLAVLPPPSLRSLWQEALTSLAARTRGELLVGIQALEPIVAALGGQETIIGICCAIEDVGRWWP